MRVRNEDNGQAPGRQLCHQLLRKPPHVLLAPACRIDTVTPGRPCRWQGCNNGCARVVGRGRCCACGSAYPPHAAGGSTCRRPAAGVTVRVARLGGVGCLAAAPLLLGGQCSRASSHGDAQNHATVQGVNHSSRQLCPGHTRCIPRCQANPSFRKNPFLSRADSLPTVLLVGISAG